MLRLRPHHINCLFFYRGMGYSKNFVERINHIESYLKKEPNAIIKFIRGCDVLCEKCPNMTKEGICETEERILELDDSSIGEYNIYLDKEYSFFDIRKEIYYEFNVDKFKRICSKCQWYKEEKCTVDLIESHKNKWK